MCRKQGVQRFYAASEQSLFQGLDLLCDSRADPMKLLQETEDKLLARAAACISEELNSLRLRGRAMLRRQKPNKGSGTKPEKPSKGSGTMNEETAKRFFEALMPCRRETVWH